MCIWFPGNKILYYGLTIPLIKLCITSVYIAFLFFCVAVESNSPTIRAFKDE